MPKIKKEGDVVEMVKSRGEVYGPEMCKNGAIRATATFAHRMRSKKKMPKFSESIEYLVMENIDFQVKRIIEEISIHSPIVTESLEDPFMLEAFKVTIYQAIEKAAHKKIIESMEKEQNGG